MSQHPHDPDKEIHMTATNLQLTPPGPPEPPQWRNELQEILAEQDAHDSSIAALMGMYGDLMCQIADLRDEQRRIRQIQVTLDNRLTRAGFVVRDVIAEMRNGAA